MGAENLAFENIGSEGIDFSVFAFFTDHTPVFLHGVENLMAHNSFMRTGNPDIVFFIRLCLAVIDALCLALHQITGINLTGQDFSHRPGLPFAVADQIFMADLTGLFL